MGDAATEMECREHRSPFKRYEFRTEPKCEYASTTRNYVHRACHFIDPLPWLSCMVPNCENPEFWSPLCQEHIEVLIDYEDTKSASRSTPT